MDNGNKGGNIGEGVPVLDPAMFLLWKKRFEVFVRSRSRRLWKIIETGNIPKFIDDYENKGDDNYVAMDLLFRALPLQECERVMMCDSAHDMWKTLVITHEGNAPLKKYRIKYLTNEIEYFEMLPRESVDSMYLRYIRIINVLKALGKTFTNEEFVDNFLEALPSTWFHVKTFTHEWLQATPLNREFLAGLSLEEVIGYLKVHERQK